MNTGAASGLSTPWRWALGLALLVTAGATWLPDEEVATGARAGAATPARDSALRQRQLTAVLPTVSEAWPAGPAPRHTLPAPLAAAALAAWGDGAARAVVSPHAAAEPASAAAAAAPAGPAYQLIGLLDEDGQQRALLQAGPRTLVVAAGDTLDARWAVERIAERSVTLRALEGDTRHTLRFRPA